MVQAPDQPLNRDPDAAVAVSVTVDPPANNAVHVVPHEMPVGDELTVPVPEDTDDLVTDIAYVIWLKFAVTVKSAVTDRVQEVPMQEPLHLSNFQPAAGVGVRVTEVPYSKL